MRHWHHIVPKHAGGSDEPSNLVCLTIEEHAEAHKKLWEQYGRWQDKIAWQTLSGQISIQEAREEMMKFNNPMYKSEVLEKMSGENHWSKREKNKDKKLFGEVNPMHRPEIVSKMSGENHWSKRPGRIHNWSAGLRKPIKLTEESKKKISLKNKGRSPPNKGQKGVFGWFNDGEKNYQIKLTEKIDSNLKRGRLKWIQKEN
jgi:hypothetical protein